MTSQNIKLIIPIALYALGSLAYAANGGVGNCRGNGNIQHGCASSVITPDLLTSTSQTNPKQPIAPIPTANELPPQQVPYQVPMAVPPQIPQPVPMLVPPQIPQITPQLVTAPPLNPSQTPVPLVINPPKEMPVPLGSTSAPVVEITDKGSSASYNQNMITNIPGRQLASSYAIFKNEATGTYRECVVSGLERRKIISANGEISYLGALPSFRTVSQEVADIPSWHPHEAGCIISLQHNKK